MYINENFLELDNSYLFSKISKRVNEFKKENPSKKIINLGIGDVTRPIIKEAVKSMHQAVDEMGDINTFRGYPPEQGYEFLRKNIVENEYKNKGIDIDETEVFVSDGAKSDTANIVDLFSSDNIIAITDPVYPVYVDSNIISGRKNNIVYMNMNEENNFKPEIPKEKVDIIYLCFPNNPTGVTLKKTELEKWVKYAIKNTAIILYDSAYEAFITEKDMPHSIYEIKEAKKVAIEFKSFSKYAGFTGLRCGYTIVPRELICYTKSNEELQLNKLWARRQSTKFNGVSYITQKAAEAVYSVEGQKQIFENIEYYMKNAWLIKEILKNKGYTIYGGVNAPYVWLKTPNNMDSWSFFDYLLKNKGIVGTPGSGFGKNGEGFFRFSAFATRENVENAIEIL